MATKKKRDYKQERKTAIARGETGCGAASLDNIRHKARRKKEKELGHKLPTSVHVHHKKSLKDGGSNSSANLAVVPASKNTSDGGKSGNREGKAAGGRKAKHKRLPTSKPKK